MLPFANAFLIGFLVEGLLAVGELAGPLSPGELVRSPLRYALLGGSVALYAALAFVPRLPTRIVLPPVLFVLWERLGAMPLAVLVSPETAAPFVAAAQTLLATGAFLLIRRRRGGAGWLLTPEALDDDVPVRGHAMRFLAVTAALLPVVIGVHAVLWAVLSLERLTGRFVWVATDGVYAEERRYTRDDKTIYLVGMIHIGDMEYYRRLAGSLPTGDVVVLAEGVSDDGSLFGVQGAQEALASRSGLVMQTEIPLGAGRIVEPADVDARELSPQTVAFLQAAAAVFESESVGEALETYAARSDTLDARTMRATVHELIHVRNARLLSHLRAALERHDRVIVPWGAAHMPGIEQEVLAWGFELVATQSHRVVGFGRGAEDR
jgi:hypothetical protein